MFATGPAAAHACLGVDGRETVSLTRHACGTTPTDLNRACCTTTPHHKRACTCRYVHIGESHRGYLGRGSVDFDGFFSALSSSGYRGPITFESFSRAVVSKDLSNTLCVWRDVWLDGEALATHARQFIARQLNLNEMALHEGA